MTRIAGVTEATPIVTAPASIKANGRARNLGVGGVDPRATYHPYHLAAGRPLGDDAGGVLLGTSTAHALGVGLGDEIELRVLLTTYPRLLLDDGGYGKLLESFGLAAQADAHGHVLSLGEAQRVAVARALVNGPRLVLADEPTGSLDSASASAVLDAMAAVCQAGAALLVVTHNPAVAARCAVQLAMRDGRLRPRAEGATVPVTGARAGVTAR